MALLPNSTITLTQSPALNSYLLDNCAVVVNVNSNDLNNKFTRVDFSINGIIFRKPVINNLSFIDTDFLNKNLKINDLDVNSFIFEEPQNVNKIIVNARAYTDSNDYSNLVSVTYYKKNTFINFPLGVDTSKSIYIYEGQEVIFLPSYLKTTSAVPAMEEITFDYYRNGTKINSIDLLNNYPFPLQFFYSNILVYKENIFPDTKTIRAVCRATYDANKIFSDSGEVKTKVFTQCENFTDLSILYLNRFSRWSSFPFMNTLKITSNNKSNYYDLNPNFFSYSNSEFLVNTRDYVTNSEIENFIECETGFLTDEEFEEMRYIINSPVHSVLIKSKIYFAQLVDKSFVPNNIDLNGLKTFKIKLKIQNVDF